MVFNNTAKLGSITADLKKHGIVIISCFVCWSVAVAVVCCICRFCWFVDDDGSAKVNPKGRTLSSIMPTDITCVNSV